VERIETNSSLSKEELDNIFKDLQQCARQIGKYAEKVNITKLLNISYIKFSMYMYML